MKTVQEFWFEAASTVAITMPRGAKVLHVETFGSDQWLYALVDPQAEMERRHFWIWRTGEPIARSEELRHVASFKSGGRVLHMFENAGQVIIRLGMDANMDPCTFRPRIP